VSEENEVVVDQPSVPLLAKMKFVGIGALVGLLLGGIGAGKVWMDMSAAVSTANASAEQAVAAAATEAETAQGKVDRMTGQTRVLKARVAASKALIEFTRQNFGSAADQLKMVRSHLQAIDPAVHGLDAAKVDAAKTAANATNIEVAGDLNAQAELLRAMGKSLDALVE
jgi:hypothetical protein